ncbi:MAG: hypothetical protein SOW68_01550 [Eubacteriales bacterium]|nr:hypothetical protein [Eubacteriales bacterium]
MGGRGASSGMSDKGKPYGSEYRSVYAVENVKFVKANIGSASAPMETMTRGRVYVTVNAEDELKFVSYYDNKNKRLKQIDLDKPHAGVSPHTHHGYNHNENDSAKGFANLTTEEKKMVARVRKLWYNKRGK